MNTQRGYINLDGAFTALIVVGVVIGAIATLILNYGLPWVWQLIKPWLHTITA